MTRPLGLKSGKGQGSFVRETRRQVIDFYGELVQNLKPWQAKAPKLHEPPPHVPATPQAEPPPFVAVDEREPGEAVTPTEPETEDAPEQPGLDAYYSLALRPRTRCARAAAREEAITSTPVSIAGR